MKAGDYVVCINDKNWSKDAHHRFDTLPVKDRVYRIRRVIPNIERKNGPAGLALEGIFGAWDMFETYDGRTVFEEYHFRKNRFRIIDETELKNLLEQTLQHPETKELFLNSLSDLHAEKEKADPGT